MIQELEKTKVKYEIETRNQSQLIETLSQSKSELEAKLQHETEELQETKLMLIKT